VYEDKIGHQYRGNYVCTTKIVQPLYAQIHIYNIPILSPSTYLHLIILYTT